MVNRGEIGDRLANGPARLAWPFTEGMDGLIDR
jgi:hypothetical protein